MRRATRAPRRKRFYAHAGVVEARRRLCRHARRQADPHALRPSGGRAGQRDRRRDRGGMGGAAGVHRSPDHAADALCQQRRRGRGRPGRSRDRRRREISAVRSAVLSRRSSRGAGGARGRSIGTRVLFWAADTLGAHFILAEGIVHVRQPDTAVAAARAALPGDPWSIAALHVVTTLTGSALLALALLARRARSGSGLGRRPCR